MQCPHSLLLFRRSTRKAGILNALRIGCVTPILASRWRRHSATTWWQPKSDLDRRPRYHHAYSYTWTSKIWVTLSSMAFNGNIYCFRRFDFYVAYISNVTKTWYLKICLQMINQYLTNINTFTRGLFGFGVAFWRTEKQCTIYLVLDTSEELDLFVSKCYWHCYLILR